MPNASNLIKFLGLIEKLKHLPRTGWVLQNVKNPETVACHMYRMAMMTFLIQDDANLNKTRCMEMALVHDLGESIVGDITPRCNITKEEKLEKEMKAFEEIAQLLDNKTGRYIKTLFVDYEEQKTEEAKFVRELDLFDMTLQAFEYEQKEKGQRRLDEFVETTRGKFSHTLIKELIDEVYKQRNDFFSIVK